MASCDLPSWWAHPTKHHLSNSTNCPAPRENVNWGAPVVMTPVWLHQAQPTCQLWQGDISSVQRGQDRWKLYAPSAQFSGEAEIAIKNKAHYHHHYKMARLKPGQGLGF